jgi:hypothetical protein
MRLLRSVKETKIYLLVVTLAAFGIGFADLVRGGISVSAILLAVAYCVLVPLVIWHWADGNAKLEKASDERPSYLAAGIVSACVLGL